MKRAAISGISGHLGQELARQLLAGGVEVHGFTRARLVSVRPTVGELNLHQVDGSTERTLEVMNEIRPDAVFHLAALTRREHRVEDITPFVQSNILFGVQLLEAMTASKCSRIVVAGSYLQHLDTAQYRAVNLYAATKQAFETVLEYYADQFGISAVRLTLCDIYSEHDTRPKLMTEIADAVAANRSLVLTNDCASVDLVHVEDAARAFLCAESLLESEAVRKGTLSRYSISSGYDIGVMELISLFETIGGRRISVNREKNISPSRILKPWRGVDLPDWRPSIALEDGIKRMLRNRRLHPAQLY